MDLRLPIVLAIALAYAVWLALDSLRDPTRDKSYLKGYAQLLCFFGTISLSLVILRYIDRLPLAEILLARVPDTRSQTGVAIAYACFIGSVVFWLASTRSKS